MINYTEKALYLYHYQHARCPVCHCYFVEGKADLHHKMRNTAGNRKRYPLLIDSIMNLQLIPTECHINKHGSCGKMTDIEAEKIERYLSQNPVIAEYVNNPQGEGLTIYGIQQDEIYNSIMGAMLCINS